MELPFPDKELQNQGICMFYFVTYLEKGFFSNLGFSVCTPGGKMLSTVPLMQSFSINSSEKIYRIEVVSIIPIL